MAVIDYTSLKNIEAPKCAEFDLPNQELLQLSMTQPYQSDQCGAFALVAAATTLGKLPADIELSVVSPATEKPVKVHLSESDTFNKLACKIYQLTGNLSAVLEDSFVEKDGYNNPATLIEVAQQFELVARMVLSTDGNEKLKNNYPTVYESCKVLLKDDGFIVDDRPEVSNPNKGQIALALMETFNETYHWIARSSDNTYFDSLRNFYPGNQYGRVGPIWSTRPYIDFGVIILLSEK
jgi:hypothetical protein